MVFRTNITDGIASCSDDDPLIIDFDSSFERITLALTASGDDTVSLKKEEKRDLNLICTE